MSKKRKKNDDTLLISLTPGEWEVVLRLDGADVLTWIAESGLPVDVIRATCRSLVDALVRFDAAERAKPS